MPLASNVACWGSRRALSSQIRIDLVAGLRRTKLGGGTGGTKRSNSAKNVGNSREYARRMLPVEGGEALAAGMFVKYAEHERADQRDAANRNIQPLPLFFDEFDDSEDSEREYTDHMGPIPIPKRQKQVVQFEDVAVIDRIDHIDQRQGAEFAEFCGTRNASAGGKTPPAT